jgi:arsenical pump membrane protein
MALGGILVAAAVLLVSSALGIPLGAPTCVAGVLALGLVTVRDRGAARAVLGNISWGVIPLVAGLFVLVEALNVAGLMHLAQTGLHWLTMVPGGYGKLPAAFGVALLSNGMNNLPVGLAAGAALQQAHSSGLLTRAVLIGVDLGPNLSVTGSLATILWLIALRRDQAEITAWEFFKAGVIVMPISLALTLLTLR